MKKILVCLSPSPSNPRIIRAAADMVARPETELVALFVETPMFLRMPDTDRKRLENNIREAEKAGARVETVRGDDIAFLISEYAKLAGIRTIVIGQSDIRPTGLLPQGTLPEELFSYMPDAEIHVIPDSRKHYYLPPLRRSGGKKHHLRDAGITLAMLAIATLIGMLFDRRDFSHSNIMLVYVLAVLLIAVLTEARIPGLASPVASVLLFNYFFVQPKFSLETYEPGYPVSFAVMFVTALIAGELAARLKQIASSSVRAAWHTRILSDTDQLLRDADSRESIFRIMASQCGKLLGREVLVAGIRKGDADEVFPYPEEAEAALLPEEQEKIRDLLREADEGKLPDSFEQLFPVRTHERIHAVLVLREKPDWQDPSERSALLSILGEFALAFESERSARKAREARNLAENERRRADLLRSISHDLRTPLTSISGSAGALLDGEEKFDAAARRSMYETIYEDSIWLIDLVENLLASTRLEGGADLRFSAELAEELIEEAVEHLRPQEGRRLIRDPIPELILVKADARLIIQVIINLAGNALKYTGPGAEIHLGAWREGDMAHFYVSDDGPGIPEKDKENIFNMFYVGEDHKHDSRKSLGLGLALVKSIVEAHGGSVSAEDNSPRGTIFRFTLPVEEVPENE